MNRINIYTDGAAKGNPGPGGYGVILEYKGHVKELSSGFRLTTNNRMELLAVIIGLESIKEPKQHIMVFSDSKYVVDAVNQGWVFDWERKKYKKRKNSDLWQRFLLIYRQHKVFFTWIKGHAGHAKNERCDQLAVDSANSNNLVIDSGYENIQNIQKNLFN